jgi:MFS transporter, PPP family, 3-phenylpropionic acid transporter
MRFREATAFIVLYVALYAAFGVASPFWPKFFETKALVPQQIGALLGAAMLTRLVAGPLVSLLADLFGSLRLALAICAALSAAAALALGGANTFQLLLIVAVVQAATLAPTTSIADALSVNVAGPRLAGRLEYGRIRGAASAAFVLGILTAGQLITPTDLLPIVWMNAGLLVAAAGATALLPGVSSDPLRQRPHRPSLPWQSVNGLLRKSRFRMVILVSSLVYGSHAVHDAFATIRWSDAGVSPSAISFLWSEAVVAEVFVFLIAGPALLKRIGVRSAATLAAVAGMVRWSIAAATTSIWLLAIIQPLHGLTFALLHLACMRVMGTLVPTRVAATAQALYAFGSGLVTAALTFLSGTLYAWYGGAAFLPMAALCLLAIPFGWFGLAEERRPDASQS